MHDAICVNLYRTKSLLNPQRKGVNGASPTTKNQCEKAVGFHLKPPCGFGSAFCV